MILYYIKALSGFFQLWYGIRFNYWTWYFALIAAGVTASVLNYNNQNRFAYTLDILFKYIINIINLYILYNYHIFDKRTLICLELITLHMYYKARVTNKNIYIILSYTFSALMNSCMISILAIQCYRSLYSYFSAYMNRFLC
jgi:hypothetical protein